MPRLLLLNDPRLVQELNQSFVRRSGFTLVLARDGSTMLDAAVTEAADLIVSSVDGGAPGGIEVCRKLKLDAPTSGIPVLLYGPPEVQARARAAGAISYLAEPWTRSQLLAAIRAVLPAAPRSAGRAAVPLMVHCAFGGKTYIAFTKDVSTTGLFLKGVSPASPGARLKLRMQMPSPQGSVEFDLEAEVVRRSEVAVNGRAVPGVGVRFLDLPIEKRLTLGRLLREQPED